MTYFVANPSNDAILFIPIQGIQIQIKADTFFGAIAESILSADDKKAFVCESGSVIYRFWQLKPDVFQFLISVKQDGNKEVLITSVLIDSDLLQKIRAELHQIMDLIKATAIKGTES